MRERTAARSNASGVASKTVIRRELILTPKLILAGFCMRYVNDFFTDGKRVLPRPSNLRCAAPFYQP